MSLPALVGSKNLEITMEIGQEYGIILQREYGTVADAVRTIISTMEGIDNLSGEEYEKLYRRTRAKVVRVIKQPDSPKNRKTLKELHGTGQQPQSIIEFLSTIDERPYGVPVEKKIYKNSIGKVGKVEESNIQLAKQIQTTDSELVETLRKEIQQKNEQINWLRAQIDKQQTMYESMLQMLKSKIIDG